MPSPCRSCTYPRVALKDKITYSQRYSQHTSLCVPYGSQHSFMQHQDFSYKAQGCAVSCLVESSVHNVKPHLLWEVSSLWRGRLFLALCKVFSRDATTLLFALLLNLRSQYPKANLKQLSLSLWESGTMSKSHHLTEQSWLLCKFIRAISLNLLEKVTKQAITFDQAHKQQPVNAALLVNLSLKNSRGWHRRSKNAFVSWMEVKPDRIQAAQREDVSAWAAGRSCRTFSLNTW